MKTTQAIKIKGFDTIPKDGQVYWFTDREIVYIVTPTGMLGNLSEHTIADDGTVTPSVLITGQDGEWHGMVKLEGYKGKG